MQFSQEFERQQTDKIIKLLEACRTLLVFIMIFQILPILVAIFAGLSR